MFPGLAVKDLFHAFAWDTSQRRYVIEQHALSAISTDRQNDGFRRLRRSARFASCLSALSNRITAILKVATQKQVLWINTEGPIATVADVLSLWDKPVMQLPHKPMCVGMPESESAELRVSLPCMSTANDPLPNPAARVRVLCGLGAQLFNQLFKASAHTVNYTVAEHRRVSQ